MRSTSVAIVCELAVASRQQLLVFSLDRFVNKPATKVPLLMRSTFGRWREDRYLAYSESPQHLTENVETVSCVICSAAER